MGTARRERRRVDGKHDVVTDMDEIVREAIAQDDITRRDYEAWECKRRSGDLDLVYKTYEPQPSMDAATQAKWDQWCDRRVRALLGPCLQVIGKKMREENVKLREEIGELRAELTLARAVMKGEISEIVRKDNRDVA